MANKQCNKNVLTRDFKELVSNATDEQHYDKMCVKFACLIDEIRPFIIVKEKSLLDQDTLVPLYAIGIDVLSLIRDKADAILLIAKLLLEQKDEKFTKRSECKRLSSEIETLKEEIAKTKKDNERAVKKWKKEKQLLIADKEGAQAKAFEEAEKRLNVGRNLREFFDEYIYQAEKIERINLTSHELSPESVVNLVAQFQRDVGRIRTKKGFTDFFNNDI